MFSSMLLTLPNLYAEYREYLMLATFPAGYRLYEHVKSVVSTETGETVKSEKSHAKGDNDRQDAYLYGHPEGPRKRYRSPKDFLNHLIWMLTDKDLDPEECTCKICCPWEEAEVLEWEAARAAEKSGQTGDGSDRAEARSESVKEPEPEPELEPEVSTKANSRATSTSLKRNSSGSLKSKSPKTSSAKVPSSDTAVPSKPSSRASSSTRASTPTALKPAVASSRGNPFPPPHNAPRPLPVFRCLEQEVDARYGQFIFRPGELVWFNRSASAWGLACVLQRQDYQQAPIQTEPRYFIQPLSHPYGRPPAGIYPESSIRPWLTWSAPEPTHEALRVNGLTYDTVDWPAVIQGHYGPGDDEVDGSIFAARSVDASYTLFGPIQLPSSGEETFWTGIFIGAEKIWIGEAVRLRTGSPGLAIMVIHNITERTQTGLGGPNGRTNPNNNKTAYLIGDVYSFSTVNITDPNATPVVENNPHLPVRLVKDLEFHNAKTRFTQNTVSSWKFVQARRRLTLADIKGRWYESSILLPLLRGKEAFEQDADKGEIGDAGMWMNSRFDKLSSRGGVCQPENVNLIGVKKETREEAFGLSIPANIRISLGTEGPNQQVNAPNMFEMMGSTATNPIVLGGDGTQNTTASQGDEVTNDTVMADSSNQNPHDTTHGVNEQVGILDEANIDQFMDLDQDSMVGGVVLNDEGHPPFVFGGDAGNVSGVAGGERSDGPLTVGEHFFGGVGGTHGTHGAH